MKKCPAATFRAFFLAISMSSSSVPVSRTSRGPEDSQKAKPNLIPGTAVTSASCTSSTVLMKWDMPSTTFMSSGFSICTTLISIGLLHVLELPQVAVRELF